MANGDKYPNSNNDNNENNNGNNNENGEKGGGRDVDWSKVFENPAFAAEFGHTDFEAEMKDIEKMQKQKHKIIAMMEQCYKHGSILSICSFLNARITIIL